MLGRLNHSRSRPASPGLAGVGQASAAVARAASASASLRLAETSASPAAWASAFAFCTSAFACCASAFACSASALARLTSSFADFTAVSASASFSCASASDALVVSASSFVCSSPFDPYCLAPKLARRLIGSRWRLASDSRRSLAQTRYARAGKHGETVSDRRGLRQRACRFIGFAKEPVAIAGPCTRCIEQVEPSSTGVTTDSIPSQGVSRDVSSDPLSDLRARCEKNAAHCTVLLVVAKCRGMCLLCR